MSFITMNMSLHILDCVRRRPGIDSFSLKEYLSDIGYSDEDIDLYFSRRSFSSRILAVNVDGTVRYFYVEEDEFSLPQKKKVAAVLIRNGYDIPEVIPIKMDDTGLSAKQQIRMYIRKHPGVTVEDFYSHFENEGMARNLITFSLHFLIKCSRVLVCESSEGVKTLYYVGHHNTGLSDQEKICIACQEGY